MKKAMTIIGIIGAVLIMMGSIFKFLHWPGAAILIVVGAPTLAVYMFLYITIQLNAVTGDMEKRFVASVGTTGIFMAMSFMFKILHWPGANSILKVFLILSGILIILSLLRAVFEKNEDLRYKYLNTFIWLLGGGIIILFPIIQILLNPEG